MNIERGSINEPYIGAKALEQTVHEASVFVPKESRNRNENLSVQTMMEDGQKTITLASTEDPKLPQKDGLIRSVWESTPIVWLRAGAGTAIDLIMYVGLVGAFGAAFGAALTPGALTAMAVVMLVMGTWGMYSRVKMIRKWQRERGNKS